MVGNWPDRIFTGPTSYRQHTDPPLPPPVGLTLTLPAHPAWLFGLEVPQTLSPASRSTIAMFGWKLRGRERAERQCSVASKSRIDVSIFPFTPLGMDVLNMCACQKVNGN